MLRDLDSARRIENKIYEIHLVDIQYEKCLFCNLRNRNSKDRYRYKCKGCGIPDSSDKI